MCFPGEAMFAFKGVRRCSARRARRIRWFNPNVEFEPMSASTVCVCEKLRI